MATRFSRSARGDLPPGTWGRVQAVFGASDSRVSVDAWEATTRGKVREPASGGSWRDRKKGAEPCGSPRHASVPAGVGFTAILRRLGQPAGRAVFVELDRERAEEIFSTYLACHARSDRAGVMALFAADAAVEDPVGSPVHLSLIHI